MRPPSERGIAMVFQSYALYPHMTVYENMSFGMKIAKAPAEEIDQAVRAAANTLGLTALLDRKPKELSGGQRQRAAIGRATVRRPKIFLFDEPLSNLDASLRVKMRQEFSRLHDTLETTMIYVTHDQVEAMTLADRIVVLRDGLVEQTGSPNELYQYPSNRFVAGFIGSPAMNFINVRLSPDGKSVEIPGDVSLPLVNGSVPGQGGKDVLLGIRPEHFELATAEEKDVLHLQVDHVELLGADTLVHGHFGEDKSSLTVRLPDVQQFDKNTILPLTIPPPKLHLFDIESGKRIGQ
jgi:ABC-type sugar transport system ATPase subunit